MWVVGIAVGERKVLGMQAIFIQISFTILPDFVKNPLLLQAVRKLKTRKAVACCEWRLLRNSPVLHSLAKNFEIRANVNY